MSIYINKHYKSCDTRYKNIEGCKNLNQSMKELSKLIKGFKKMGTFFLKKEGKVAAKLIVFMENN